MVIVERNPINLLFTTGRAHSTLLFSGAVHPWRSLPRCPPVPEAKCPATYPSIPTRPLGSRHRPTYKVPPVAEVCALAGDSP